jgi:hypothetical protein
MAKVARFGADHASLIFVAVILVACNDDADGTLLNLTVIRTDWPAATRMGRCGAPSKRTPRETTACGLTR